MSPARAPRRSSAAERLLSRLDQRTARLGVIGLGYVGLPLAVEFAQAGFRVVGIDIDERKVRSVNAGTSHIEDVATATLKPLVAKNLIRAQADYKGCDKL